MTIDHLNYTQQFYNGFFQQFNKVTLLLYNNL